MQERPQSRPADCWDCPDWTHEILDERLTTFPDGISKSVTDVQNTYFLEDGITAPKRLCLSDMSHLYAGGLGLTYNTLEL